jgi:hypothetical protein
MRYPSNGMIFLQIEARLEYNQFGQAKSVTSGMNQWSSGRTSYVLSVDMSLCTMVIHLCLNTLTVLPDQLHLIINQERNMGRILVTQPEP